MSYRHVHGILAIVSAVFVLLIAIGGFFLPQLGFALAGLMGIALALSLLARFGLARRRVFCSAVCPRGRSLSFALAPFSRGKPLPTWVRSTGIRRLVCGFMMFCLFGSLMRVARGFSSLPAFEAAGRVFWLLCVVSLSVGVYMGLRYRPRAWCVLCPLGTLQDTVAPPTLPRSEPAGEPTGDEPAIH